MKASIGILVAASCWLLHPTLSAQPLTYDITFNGISIGNLQTNVSHRDNQVHYTVTADVTVRLLTRKRMQTLFTSTYMGEKLSKSTFHDRVNENTRHLSQVQRQGADYHIQVNDVQSRLANRDITYSTAMLYYREPVNVKQLFSERHGIFCAMRQVGPHRYELTLPEGQKNYYTYAGGICREVEVNHPFYRFYFRHKPDATSRQTAQR